MNGKNKNFRKVYQTNPYYNPEMSCNGGGYYQTFTIIQYGDWRVEIEYTGCGDFGERTMKTIYYKGEEFDTDVYNEMDNYYYSFQKRSSQLMYDYIVEQDITTEYLDYEDYCKDILNCNKSTKIDEETEDDLIFWEE